MYTKVKQQFTLGTVPIDFEVVFVSMDKDQAGFTQYFASMPWLAVPYPERVLQQHLVEYFGITTIPSLVILQGNETLLCVSGVEAVRNDINGLAYPWSPAAIAAAAERVDPARIAKTDLVLNTPFDIPLTRPLKYP